MGIAPTIDLDYTPDVARLWLLEPDGTPTGEKRWDRKLRLDGHMTMTYGVDVTAWLRFADGERGLWQWVVAHLLRDREIGPRRLMYPLAVEWWAPFEDGQWRRWTLPRIDPFDTIDKMPPEDGWPDMQWQGRKNPNWPDEQTRDYCLSWRTVDGRPDEAPPEFASTMEAAAS